MRPSSQKEKTLKESLNSALPFAIAEGYKTKLPKRNSERAAGIDIYLPEFTETFRRDFEKVNDSGSRFGRLNPDNIMIAPYFSILIPTGIHFNIPEDTYLDVATKSGAFKRTHLKVGSHVIDSDYQGMIYISLFNTSKFAPEIKPGDSIAQIIHKSYIHSSVVEIIPFNTLYPEKTGRGEGGFGSTNG